MGLDDMDLTDLDKFVEGVPHEEFERLRREDPVHWHEESDGPGFWSLTRHEDVVQANRDARTFSSEEGGVVLKTPDDLESTRLQMISMDPPRHTKLRMLVSRGFTPRRIEAMEKHIREIATSIIDDVAPRGECDFVVDVAAELPLRVIAELLGVPDKDRHDIFRWTNMLIGSEDPEYHVSDDAMMEATGELYGYANALAARRREEPADDLVSALVGAEVEGEALTDLEFNLFFILLGVAGNETTRNLISHAMLALMEHPDQLQRLVADPELFPTAIEEFLRWATPVMYFRRTAMSDVEIRGQRIRQGDKVALWYMSANRDESVFDHPQRIDVTRSPNDHVSFGGGGPHYCLGSHLARLEGRVMLEELLRRLPDMALSGPVERLRSNWINGIKHMPVTYTPAPVGAHV